MPGFLDRFNFKLRNIKPSLNDSEPLQCKESPKKSRKPREENNNLEPESDTTSFFLCCVGCVKKPSSYNGMTQNQSCCCTTPHKDLKSLSRKSRKSQKTFDPSKQCERESKKNRRTRKSWENVPCCCGRRRDHVTSGSRAPLSPLSTCQRPADKTGPTTIHADASSFAKYNGLINNPHRREHPMSIPVPAKSQTAVPASVRRRPAKSTGVFSNRNSIESTCYKPPPNRTVINNNGLFITTLSQGELLVNDETTGVRHQVDRTSEFPATSETYVANLPGKRVSFPGKNACCRRSTVRSQYDLPQYEHISQFPNQRTFFRPMSEPNNNDPPPEYSEPPSYYANS